MGQGAEQRQIGIEANGRLHPTSSRPQFRSHQLSRDRQFGVSNNSRLRTRCNATHPIINCDEALADEKWQSIEQQRESEVGGMQVQQLTANEVL
jgi:hypothetical protein